MCVCVLWRRAVEGERVCVRMDCVCVCVCVCVFNEGCPVVKDVV